MAKYTINHSCGHQEVVDLGGKVKDRESRAEWLERQDCKDCWKAKEAAKAARDAQLAADQELIAQLLKTEKFKNYSKIAAFLGVHPVQIIRVAHGQQCLRTLSREKLAALR